jgi:hypothetical protein
MGVTHLGLLQTANQNHWTWKTRCIIMSVPAL